MTRYAGILLAASFALAVAPCAAGHAQGGPGGEQMPVAGGTARLLRAAGVRAPLEPARAFLALIRTLHGALPARSASTTPEGLLSSLKAMARAADGGRALAQDSAAESDAVPALLPLACWQDAVFHKDVPLEALAPAILADRGAALLYYGLFALDDETLAFFAAHPSLLSSIARNPGAFAAFADAIVIHNQRMVLPGGARAVARWEDLAGARADDPQRFIARLVDRDDGRLAWFLSAVASLDRGRQALALAHLQEFYPAFATFQRMAWSLPRAPFTRFDIVDPEFVLSQLLVNPDGTLAPPDDIDLWEKVFGVLAGIKQQPQSTVAPSLLRQIVSADARTRRTHLDTVLFAQRLCARQARGGAGIAPETILALTAAFAGREALMTKLEAMGFTAPDDFLAALRATARLTADTDSHRAALRLALFQGTLAVIARLGEVGTLQTVDVHGLARQLFALDVSDAAGYPHAVARLIETMLERAPRAVSDPAADAEMHLLDALAGLSVARPLPVVEWEGRRYRVDLAAAERTKLARIREKQGGGSLQAALDVHRLAAAVTAPGAPRKALREMATAYLERHPELRKPDRWTLVGFDVGPELNGLRAAAAELAEGRADAASASVIRRLSDGLAVLLADALCSHVYALAIGDPDASLLLAGNPARDHDFGLTARPGEPGPWSTGAITRRGSGVRVVGSLIALDRALAVHWLRPTMFGAPIQAPTIMQGDVAGFGESVAALNPFRLTDSGRDTIAAALRRGRARLAEAEGSVTDIDALAASLGVDGWRRRLLRLAAHSDTDTVGQYVSLGEVLQLGLAGAPAPELQAWGTARRLLDGSLGTGVPERLAWRAFAGRPGGGLLPTQMVDLHLRVAERLAELGLPAGLLPGVLAYALWDLMADTQMADFDDWLSVIRAAQSLSADRMENYVSAMVASGALIEVGRREGK